MVFIPDQWRNSQLDIQVSAFSNSQSRQTRQGLVTDIDLSNGALSSDALYKALQEIIAVVPVGSALSASQPEFIFTRAILTGASGNAARAQLIYEIPQVNGAQPNMYVITDDAVTQQYETNMIPGTRTPIALAWDAPDSSTNDSIPQDYLTFRVDRAVRRISVQTLIHTSNVFVPPTYQSEVNKVNDAPWLGLDTGYWKVQSWGLTATRYSGYVQTQAVAISKQDEDWSQTGILKSKQTNRYVNVPDDAISEMNGKAYEFGIIYDGTSGGSGKKTGIVRVGFYKTTDISSIFGISGEDDGTSGGGGASFL